jgi:hypothetical protein
VNVSGRKLAVDPITGGIFVFLVVLVAALLLIAGFGVPLYRGRRKERRLREG